jgi:hypothetical protein
MDTSSVKEAGKPGGLEAGKQLVEAKNRGERINDKGF